MTTTGALVTAVDFVTVSTRNLAAAEAFCADVLGPARSKRSRQRGERRCAPAGERP